MLREKRGIALRMLFIASIMGGVTTCKRGRRGERAQHPDITEGKHCRGEKMLHPAGECLGQGPGFLPRAWLDPVVCVTRSIRDKVCAAIGSA